MRPSGHCICDSLPEVPTRTSILILQHPQERMHPFGTARLMGLSMPNAKVHTIYGGLSHDLHCPLDLPADTALLYPHRDAVELSQLDEDDRPSTLVVLDGTWSHSRRIYNENSWLRSLRHVRIDPRAPSRYRIRKEPSPECLSTLEATIEALRILEPDTAGFDALIAAFDRMIDRQVDHASSAERVARFKRRRSREPRRISPLLDDPQLVLLYAESSLPGGDPNASRELVQVVGARLDDDAPFEIVVRPSGTPPPRSHLDHMGLTLDDVLHGATLDEARRQLARVAGKGPFAAWTQSSLDWADPLLPAGSDFTVLKTNYCNQRNHRAGLLEDIVAKEGLASPRMDCRGRAADRLANALAIGRWLRAQRGQAQ